MGSRIRIFCRNRRISIAFTRWAFVIIASLAAIQPGLATASQTRVSTRSDETTQGVASTHKTPQTIYWVPIPNQLIINRFAYVNAYASSSLTVTLTSNSPHVCSNPGITVTLLAAGICSLTATQPGNEVYDPAQPITATFVISKASQSIAAFNFNYFYGAVYTVTFGASPVPVNSWATSGLSVTISSQSLESCEIQNEYAVITGGGRCFVTASQPGNDEYEPAPTFTATLDILLRPQSIVFATPATQTFGAGYMVLSATASSGLTVTFTANTPTVCTTEGQRALFISVGICSLTAWQAGDRSNLAASPVTRTFNIKHQVFASRVSRRWDVYPQSRGESLSFYMNEYLAPPTPPIEWAGNVGACNAGTTSAAFKAAIARRINYFRAMAGIQAGIIMNDEYSRQAQQAAMMMSANRDLSHGPPATWRCYTEDGRRGAGSSNLFLGVYGVNAIDGYIWDFGSNNSAVGHRRWILYPPTRQMGTGDIPPHGDHPPTNALWVFDNFWDGNALSRMRDGFIAWPPPGYVPQRVVYPRWSFSHPSARFDNAIVSMSSNGEVVPIVLEPLAYGYGLNTLVWRPYDFPDYRTWPAPSALDTPYQVRIENVIIDGQPRSFTYTVNVMLTPDVQSGQVAPQFAPDVRIE